MYYSDMYHVSSATMADIVACESNASTTIVGDNGDSFGLVQIDLKYHPDISKEQALDPDFSLNFLASKLSLGEGHLWSCFKN